jgi:hypothetical protein
MFVPEARERIPMPTSYNQDVKDMIEEVLMYAKK